MLIVAVWNLGGTAEALTIRAHRVGSTSSDLARVAATLRAYPGCLAADARPSPRWAPDVTTADVSRWITRGWYHPSPTALPLPECRSK